jgi:acyl-CoA thioester hydrolase
MSFEPYRFRARVRFAHCDPQGVVYFARYPYFIDDAFTDFWSERVGPYGAMVEQGTDFVVAEMNVRYRAPALFDEDIEVALDAAKVGDTSLTAEYRILRGDDLLIEATLRYVCIDPPTKQKKRVPDDVRAALS